MEGNQHVEGNHPHFSENHHHENHHEQQAQKKTTFDKAKVKAKFREFVHDIEKLGDEYLVQKAPYTLPVEVKDPIIKAAPYLVILGLIFQIKPLLVSLSVGFVTTFFSPLVALFLLIGGVLALFSFILQITAVKPLFARAHIGWKKIFYAMLLNFVVAILGGAVTRPIIGTVLGLYVAFQMKDKYNN